MRLAGFGPQQAEDLGGGVGDVGARSVDSADADVKAWGALIVASQNGTREAMNWLDRQSDTDSETRSRIRNLVNKLEEAVSQAESLEDHKKSNYGFCHFN